MKQTTCILVMITLLFIQPDRIYSQNPVKIMPLGNSITQGWTDGSLLENQMKGYRYDLKQLLQGAGYSIDFTGSESSGSAYFTDHQHAGIGGSRDQYVARLLFDGYDERNDVQILVPARPYLDEYNPDIILLHIGTNDVTHEADPGSIQQVSAILDLVDQYESRSDREVIVFLAMIINRKKPWVAGSGYQTTVDFNIDIKAMALARIAAGDKLVIVDMEHDAGFVYDATDMADNLHPNAAGYLKMANLWHSSIVNNYNTAPVISPIPDQILDEDSSCNPVSLDDYVSDIQDQDGDLSWSVTQLGTPRLDITLDEDNILSAIPLETDWFGSQTAVFTVTDNGKNGKYVKSVSDTIVFTVLPVNDAPLFTSDPILSIDKGQLYTYTFSATDVDPGDILKYDAIELPAWLTLYADSKLLAGIPPQQGNFEVILRVTDGFTYTDQPFIIEVIGQSPVTDAKGENRVGIYPNPASDYFLLSLPEHSGNVLFNLFDITGKPVLSRTICSSCELEIVTGQENLLPGVYFYKVIMEREICTGKLVIN
ncbi:MAG TPA: GDSL-type esterase/lipase family protein [Bacteroidales bacterium]|nr:GDSL-type esterase/lipase family protein [Bacteroidales bacterium]